MGANRPTAGTVIGGRYRLESSLGTGGMDTVWRAEHLALRSAVAIKLIHAESLGDEAHLGRFMREAQAAAALRSPHVVQILDYGVDDGIPYIAMELLEGETLGERLARVGTLDAETTARVVSQIARAIARAHEAGVIHRDLKPDNVFLIQNDEEEIAKVLDFGIAKTVAIPLDASTRTGALIGTPYYMSPEQLRGAKQVDHRADLWALGVITFECLTGRRPFTADNLGELVLQVCSNDPPVPSKYGAVPPGFDAWFARAVAREKDDRFQSARELSRDLRALVGIKDPITAQSGSRSSPDAVAARTSSPPRTSHSLAHTARKESSSGARRTLFAAGAVVALGAVIFGISFVRSKSVTNPQPEPSATQAPAAPPATSIEPESPAPLVAPAVSSSSPPVASVAPPVRPATKSAPPPSTKTPSARPTRPSREGDPGVGF